jgi:hypothetical protein
MTVKIPKRSKIECREMEPNPSKDRAMLERKEETNREEVIEMQNSEMVKRLEKHH